MGKFQQLLSDNKKKNYTDIAYEGIKKLILDGEIRPGELIQESDIAEYLNMSRTPVREAVRRLEAEKVLFVRPGLGAFLEPLSIKDMKDIFEVRETLELIASKTAIREITDDEIKDLKHKFEELTQAREMDEKERYRRFNELDGIVHDLILERTDNGYVKILAKHIYFKAKRYRMLSSQVYTNLDESVRRHLELLDCLEQRNKEQFQACIREHIRWSSAMLLEYLNRNY